jgi:hypothetical protein
MRCYPSSFLDGLRIPKNILAQGPRDLPNTKDWYLLYRGVTSLGFYVGISDSKKIQITMVR